MRGGVRAVFLPALDPVSSSFGEVLSCLGVVLTTWSDSERPFGKRKVTHIEGFTLRTLNGFTEAIDGRLKHLCGSALGLRNLTNCIARSLLESGGSDHNYTSHCKEQKPRRTTSQLHHHTGLDPALRSVHSNQKPPHCQSQHYATQKCVSTDITLVTLTAYPRGNKYSGRLSRRPAPNGSVSWGSSRNEGEI